MARDGSGRVAGAAAFVAAGLLFAASARPATALDNGVALTPPMGWRNWNFFAGSITQSIMEGQMRAMTAPFAPIVGLGKTGNASLLDAGYAHAGLDDAWQACHTGVAGPGGLGSFHNQSGFPLVNRTRFTDMRAMVNLGHSLGLEVGWYDNNCICGEGSSRLSEEQVALDVHGDVEFITDMGFDGLKADGCGPGRNMTELAGLLNRTGRKVYIENCHYNKVAPGEPMPPGARPDHIGRIFPYWTDNVSGGTLVCPENSFRASGDIRNSWESWFGNLDSLVPYQDPVHPISQPGCWAYADMLMVGVFASPYNPSAGPPASLAEWRSHFGAWTVASSPLILSFDLTNATTMRALWPVITNLEAIGVNQAWAGHPGRQVLANASWQLWAKQLGQRRFAVLAVNMQRPARGGAPSQLDVDLASISPALGGAGSVAVRDVWAHANLPPARGGVWRTPALAPHDSAYVVFDAGAGQEDSG